MKVRLNRLELLLEPPLQIVQARIVQLEELVHVDEVGAKRHLQLLLGLFQVAVKHLQNRILAVHVSLMVLRNNLNVLFQRLGLGQTHYLAPLTVCGLGGLGDRVSDGPYINGARTFFRLCASS